MGFNLNFGIGLNLYGDLSITSPTIISTPKKNKDLCCCLTKALNVTPRLRRGASRSKVAGTTNEGKKSWN